MAKKEEQVIMKDLGSYSYKTVTPNKYIYTDANNNVFYFQITHVNVAIAAIQFQTDASFSKQAPVPMNFMLVDSNNIPILPFNSSLFITWVESYTLSHNGAIVWKHSSPFGLKATISTTDKVHVYN